MSIMRIPLGATLSVMDDSAIASGFEADVAGYARGCLTRLDLTLSVSKRRGYEEAGGRME